MADDQEVVIIGSDGTEHAFPAGMDPKKAAAIVRSQSPVTNVNIPVGGVRRAAMESATVKDETTPSPLIEMLRSAAHPQTWGDLASLAIPSAVPTRAIRGMLRSAVDTIGGATEGSKLGFPGRVIMGQLRKAQAEGPLIQRTQPPIDRYAPSLSDYKPTIQDAQVMEAAPPELPASWKPLENTFMGSSAELNTRIKPHFTGVDVQRIKDLMHQGVSEKAAIEFVQSQKAYPKPVSPDEFFNRR